MKISIITPSYNQGRFIEEAIQSVLKQNYPDFEHIVVDGNSTDDTVERLKKYPHLKWISEKDEGQSDAINKGFKMATGDVIAWLNCDDVYLPEVFDRVSAVLTANEHISGVYGNVLMSDLNFVVKKYKKSHKANRIFSLFHTYIASEALFIRKRIVDHGIYVDKDFNISMDKEFVAHILFERFKLKHISEPFAYFRMHDTNKSLNTKAVKMEVAKEGVIILNRYLKLNMPVNTFTINMYRGLVVTVLPIRKFFKTIQTGSLK